MLQRAIATALCVLGLVAGGLAVGSATVWRPADSLVASAQGEATLLMTDPGVLDLGAEQVRLTAEGSGEAVVVALGRTSDVEAWLGEDAHTRVTGLLDETSLRTEDVAAREPEPEEDDGDDEDAEQDEGDQDGDGEEEAPEPPDPRGSDLWVTELVAEGTVELDWTAEQGRWSVLVATVGEGAEPPSVTLRWPQEVRTPWFGPGLAIGVALVLAGALWWFMILRQGTHRARAHDVVQEAPSPAPPVPAPFPGATRPVEHAPPTSPAPPRRRSPVPGEPVQPPAGTDRPAGAGGPAAGAPLTRRQLRELERTGRIPAVPDSRPPSHDAPSGAPDVPAQSGEEAAPPTSASADAWRRAWGFPGGGRGPDQDHEEDGR